jgi:hypothetical protein
VRRKIALGDIQDLLVCTSPAFNGSGFRLARTLD